MMVSRPLSWRPGLIEIELPVSFVHMRAKLKIDGVQRDTGLPYMACNRPQDGDHHSSEGTFPWA